MANKTVTAPRGFFAGAAKCGIKTNGKLDMGVLVADATCTAAAVFTRNRFCGAPVVVGRQHVRSGKLRAIVVNSGCSNVATGARGVADAKTMCSRVGALLEVPMTQVLPASTGVIGEFLPMEKVRRGIDLAMNALSDTEAAGRRFAEAIMTTDLKVKQACERVRVGRSRVTIAGCAKGSGMIAPNMATMLGFLTTDADISARTLRRVLVEAVEPTFNRITVDECQSTSDTVAILANGASARVASGRGLKAFASALREVCESLAYAIVSDGEGATRVLEVRVSGARTAKDAHAAARAIAVSPLVKTALNGGDPNWGRIVQALGATSVTYRPERVTVRLDKTTIFAKGAPVSRLNGDNLARIMQRRHVPLSVNLGAGRATDRVLTCDLSRDYVTINADYHT